jgi:hypothetical protein
MCRRYIPTRRRPPTSIHSPLSNRGFDVNGRTRSAGIYIMRYVTPMIRSDGRVRAIGSQRLGKIARTASTYIMLNPGAEVPSPQ